MLAQGLRSLRQSEHFRRPNRQQAQLVRKASRRGVVRTIGCSIVSTALSARTNDYCTALASEFIPKHSSWRRDCFKHSQHSQQSAVFKHRRNNARTQQRLDGCSLGCNCLHLSRSGPYLRLYPRQSHSELTGPAAWVTCDDFPLNDQDGPQKAASYKASTP